jgi:iron complex transport system substrate-binding protein
MTKTIKRPAIKPPPLPEIDDVTRREFLIGAAGLLLLPAGCGGGEGREGETTENTRTIEHELGTTEVPMNPQRVVALEPFQLDNMLALDEKPLAILTADELFRNDGFPSYLGDRVEGIEKVGGSVGEPNLESLAGLEPDLILSVPGNEGIHEELSRIVPTVAVGDATAEDWRTGFRRIAEPLGKRNRDEQVISEFDERMEEFKRRAGERLEVSLVNSWETGNLLYLSSSFAGRVVQEAGFTVVPEQEEVGTGEFFVEVSLERLDLADAVFFIEDVPGESLVRENQQLWSQLEAVQEGRVYEVSNEYWLASRGPIAANLILDDLGKHLLEEA